MIKNISICIFIIFFTACIKENDRDNILINMNSINNVSQEKWDKLAGKKIFFGHRSVGYNMIDGIKAHLAENPNLKLNIEEGNSPSFFDHPVFAHSKNGQNTDPKSKIDAFYKELDGGLGDKVDIAGFKFCYIDFDNSTDINEIFLKYKLKMNEISDKYPHIKIIHFTVPLRTFQRGPKEFIKKLIGKDIGLADNTARQQFNDLLLNEFKEQPIFDLAKYESTYLDGQREFSIINNEKIYSMVPIYSTDGGHLSEIGKHYLGGKLLLFLVEESSGR